MFCAKKNGLLPTANDRNKTCFNSLGARAEIPSCACRILRSSGCLCGQQFSSIGGAGAIRKDCSAVKADCCPCAWCWPCHVRSPRCIASSGRVASPQCGEDVCAATTWQSKSSKNPLSRIYTCYSKRGGCCMIAGTLMSCISGLLIRGASAQS